MGWAGRTRGLRRGGTGGGPGNWNVVAPGYSATLTLPVSRGRDFGAGGVSGAPRVAIINETMARLIWGTADVLGRTVEANDGGAWESIRIVGVTSNTRLTSIDGPVNPTLYVPFAQRFSPRVSLIVKTAGGTAIPQSRATIRQMAPNLPLSQAMPLSDVTSLTTIPERIAAWQAASVASACCWRSASTASSYDVNRRVREIGDRVVPLPTGEVVRGRAAYRAGIGLPLGAAASQVLHSLLVGVSAFDPITFGGGAALFLIVACGQPASRQAPLASIPSSR